MCTSISMPVSELEVTISRIIKLTSLEVILSESKLEVIAFGIIKLSSLEAVAHVILWEALLKVAVLKIIRLFSLQVIIFSSPPMKAWFQSRLGITLYGIPLWCHQQCQDLSYLPI